MIFQATRPNSCSLELKEINLALNKLGKDHCDTCMQYETKQQWDEPKNNLWWKKDPNWKEKYKERAVSGHKHVFTVEKNYECFYPVMSFLH